MSPLPKRLLIIAVALGLLLVLVLAAALAYVNTGAFRRQMIGRIDAAIAGRIEWSHQRIAPFAGDLVLGDIRLLDADGDTLATVQRLSVSLRWLSLARRTLHITQLRIDAPVVFAVLDADDQLNLLAALSPTAPPPSEPPPDTSSPGIPFGIRLDDLQLHQGRVTFERPAEALSGEAADIAITGRGNLAHPSARVALTLGQVRLQTPDGDHRLHDVTLTAEYDARAADPIALALQTPRSRLTITGRVDPDPAPLTLALVGDLDLDLVEIQAWLPESIDLSGRVTGRITANGAPADPDATLTLAWNDGGVLGLDLRQLNVALELAQRQVQLQQLAVRAPWGEVDLTGGADLRPLFPASFTHQAAGIEALAYDLTLAVRQFTPGRLGAIDLPLNGTWQARAHMAGSGLPGPDGGTGQGEVDLQIADLVLVEAGIPTSATLTLAARWDAQHLTLVRGEGGVGNQRIVADGRIDWEGLQLTAAGHFHSPRLEELGALLGVALPTGSAALEFRGQGDARQPEVHAVLVARELAWQTWTIGQLLVEADLDGDGVVQLPRLVLENQGSFIEGQGEVALLAPGGGLRDDPTLSVTLDLDPLQAAHFAADLPADLRLHGRLAVNGPLDDPRALLTVAPSTLQWGAVAARVTGALGWQSGVLSVSDLHLSTDRSAVRLDGKAQWQDPHSGQWTDDPQLSARLTADPLQLEDFLDGYQGAVTVQADLDGTLSQLRGTFGLDSGALDLGVQKVAAVHLAGRLTPGKAHADTLTVTLAPGQQIQASGWYGFDRHFEAQVDLQGLDLRHIDALGPDAPLKGTLELTLTAAGTVADPEGNGHLRIREPRLDDRLFDDFEARFRLQQQQLNVDADLTFTLAANARLDSGDFDVTALFDRTDLAPYLALLGDLPWSGRLSGRVRADGNWHAPAAARAELALTDTSLRYQDIDLLRIDTLSARLADGVLDLPATRLALLQQGHLTVSAAGALQRNLTVRVEGLLPTAAVTPFTDQIAEGRGEMRIDAQARGPVDAMAWQADLELARVGFLLSDLQQSVQNLNGRLTLTPEQITLAKLAGMLDDGRFTLDGQLGLTEFKPTRGRLAITLQALPLQVPDTMDLSIAGDLVLTGDTQRSRLSGNLVLLEGAYYKDLKLNLLSVVTQTQRPTPAPAVATPPAWREAIDLNVGITHRFPFLVDNNVARMEILPDLRLTGTAARPLLDGRARVGEGEVYFRRHAFTVTRGVVDFIHPYRIEPNLDIIAETRIRQWRIVLAATGPPDNLAIALHSDPPESDSDIISLILIGRTTRESGGSGTTTGQMLASLIESAWGEDIKQGVGVDILEVETGAVEPGESSDRIQVTVGKRLSPRLLVKYAVESSGGETIQRAISEYRLLEHLLASGFQDTAGIYGGELLFRMEFR